MGRWPALFAHAPGATCRAPYRSAGESLAHADLKARAAVALGRVGAPVVAFEVVSLFDDAEVFVPAGRVVSSAEAPPVAVCRRCGDRPRGSFTGGPCVPCTTSEAAP
jgi:hypothetical protein